MKICYPSFTQANFNTRWTFLKYLSFVDTDKFVLAHSISDESASMNADIIGESSRSAQPSSKRRKVETETYDLLSDFKAAATPLSTADSDDTRHELDENTCHCLWLKLTRCNFLFWKQNESAHKLPKLASVARKLLAIPATSRPTPSERIFSLCGLTPTKRRNFRHAYFSEI